MTTSNALSIFFGIAVLLASDLKGAEGIHFELKPAEIRAGERARLAIRIPKGTNELEPPIIYDELFAQSTQFSILDKQMNEEPNEYVFEMEITTHKPGEFILPPIGVKQGANSYSTDALTLKTLASRTSEDFALNPDYDELSVPLPWLRWVVVFLGTALLFWITRKLVEKWSKLPVKVDPLPPPAEEDPIIWLRRQLDAFFSSLSPDDILPSDKSDELVEIVKSYFSKTSKSPVKAWTAEEFRTNLVKDRAAQELADRMKRWTTLHYQPKSRGSVALESVAMEIEKVLLP